MHQHQWKIRSRMHPKTQNNTMFNDSIERCKLQYNDIHRRHKQYSAMLIKQNEN